MLNQSPLETEEIEENLDRNSNILNLKILTGGKGPPTDKSNWLKDLKEGTIFIASEKNTNSFVDHQFEIIDLMFLPSIRLYSYENGSRFWTQSKTFSRRWELIMIIGQKGTEEEEKEEDGPENGEMTPV